MGSIVAALTDNVAAAADGEATAPTGAPGSGDNTDGAGASGEEGSGGASDGGTAETPEAVAARQAVLASDVYERNAGNLPDGWTRIDPDNIPPELRAHGITRDLLIDEDIGYDAAIYQSEDGEYVVAFRGTDGDDPVEARRDHFNANLPQNAGFESEQYNRAVELVERMKEAAPEGELSVTGHSLGGGLASVAALANEVPATTYDPAGIHPNTLERYGADPALAEQYITGYYVDGEILSNDVLPVQIAGVWTRQTMQEPIGTLHRLPAIDPDGRPVPPIVDPGPGPGFFPRNERQAWNEAMAEFEAEGVRRHGMDWVHRGLEAAGAD